MTNDHHAASEHTQLLIRSLDGGGACHLRLGEAEAGEEFLVDGGQQLAVSLGQLDFLHREVGVEVAHVERRQLYTHTRQTTIAARLPTMTLSECEGHFYCMKLCNTYNS